MITRRTFAALMVATALAPSPARAADMPKPFDEPDKVKIALVRYLSSGDFFEAYLSGVQAQAKALRVDLRIFDSRQDAALQSEMVDRHPARPDGIDEGSGAARGGCRHQGGGL